MASVSAAAANKHRQRLFGEEQEQEKEEEVTLTVIHGTGEEDAAPASGASACAAPASGAVTMKEVLSDPSSVRFCAEVSTLSFFKLLANTAVEVGQVVLWFRNTHGSKVPDQQPGVRPWAGIAVDQIASSKTAQLVARLPLPADKILLSPGQVEVGVCVDAVQLLKTLKRMSDDASLFLFQNNTEEVMYVHQVKAKRNFCSYSLPLLDGVGEHMVLPSLDMQWDVTLPDGKLQAMVSTAMDFGEALVTFELREWPAGGPPGLTFVFKPHYTVEHMQYVSPLAKEDSMDHVLKRWQVARQTFASMDAEAAGDQLSRRVASGLAEVEAQVRAALFKLYDNYATPDGMVKPPRTSGPDTPLDVCEKELRDLRETVRQTLAAGGGGGGSSSSSSSSVEGVAAAVNALEVLDAFNACLTSAPTKVEAVERLNCVYSASFSAKALTAYLKPFAKCTLQLHLPRDSTGPICIWMDLCGAAIGEDKTYLAWVVLPKLREEDAATTTAPPDVPPSKRSRR